MGNVEEQARALKEARHKGWLAGVALRLECAPVSRNPYSKNTVEYLEWDIGFEQGFNDLHQDCA